MKKIDDIGTVITDKRPQFFRNIHRLVQSSRRIPRLCSVIQNKGKNRNWVFRFFGLITVIAAVITGIAQHHTLIDMRLIFHTENAQLYVLFFQDFCDVAIQTMQDGSGVIGCHGITVTEIRCADDGFSVIYHRIENGCGDIPVTHQKLERKIFLCWDRVIHEVSSSLYLLPPN